MPVMGLMAPNETVLAKNLLNQVRIGPRERPVNTGDYLQQWLPTSGAARPLRFLPALAFPSVSGDKLSDLMQVTTAVGSHLCSLAFPGVLYAPRHLTQQGFSQRCLIRGHEAHDRHG